jgi:Xaa-Pro aminopeptidase
MRDDRLARLRARMYEHSVHLVVLSPGDDLRYFAGSSPFRDGRFFALLVAQGGWRWSPRNSSLSLLPSRSSLQDSPAPTPTTNPC